MFSPDGRTLIYNAILPTDFEAHLPQLVELDLLDPAVPATTIDCPTFWTQWCPDGTTLIGFQRDREEIRHIVRFDRLTGTRSMLSPEQANCFVPQVSPKVDLMAYVERPKYPPEIDRFKTLFMPDTLVIAATSGQIHWRGKDVIRGGSHSHLFSQTDASLCWTCPKLRPEEIDFSDPAKFTRTESELKVMDCRRLTGR